MWRLYTSGARQNGEIVVFNVDEGDRTSNGEPGGSQKWRQVIGKLDGGLEPRDIRATSDPNRMVFASYLSIFNGFGTIQVTNSNPASYAATPKRQRMRITDRFFDQKYELDILTTSSVVVNADMTYGFRVGLVPPGHYPPGSRSVDQR